jgi:hypothetical protein
VVTVAPIAGTDFVTDGTDNKNVREDWLNTKFTRVQSGSFITAINVKSDGTVRVED